MVSSYKENDVRKKLIAGNWKMFKTVPEAVNLVNSIKAGIYKLSDADIVVCPPFTALQAVSQQVNESVLDLGAQDMHFETEGAYTGEISPLMLKDLNCRYVILGHSERRACFKESDELINKKAKAAVKFNLIPIVCVGETLPEREAGQAEEVVRKQVHGSLAAFTAEEMEKVVIAYEPVWAIGTGKTATPEQAQEMHRFVRGLVRDLFGDAPAEELRILYGGSVKPDNTLELMKQPDVDGALVGGASLKAESFVQIVTESLSVTVKKGS
jgi:triosephosphate isomerase